MPVTLVLIRMLAFAVIIGISAVVVALAAHYHNFSGHLDGVPVMWGDTLETYALAVGAINIAIFLPMLIIDRVRRNTTPPVIAELILTVIPAILYLALALRINSMGINTYPCSFIKTALGPDYDQLKKDGIDLVSICQQFKIFEYLGFIAFGLLALYFLFILAAAVMRHRNGDGPWTKPTHELQTKEW